MAYVQCRGEKGGDLFPFICIGNGICLLLLFLTGNMGMGMNEPEVALFVHLVAEILILMICALCFLFWNKEDPRRVAQVYYAVFAILLLSSFSKYDLELVMGLLTALLIVKLFNRRKALSILEIITAVWIGIAGLWLSNYWYCWVLVGALVLGLCKVYYCVAVLEIITAVSSLLVWWSQCHFALNQYGVEDKWFYPVCAGILLLLFLLFNNLPWLKKYNQLPYNIFNLLFMSGIYLMALLVRETVICLLMMALGAISITIMLGRRYKIYLPRRYFAVAIFLTCYALLGSFYTPVIVSIILMAVALSCVGIGFKAEDKIVRIYGLVMAAAVCLKLVFFDFIEVSTIYRIIVFLVVGILALVISFLYIMLEKNAEKKREEKLSRIVQEERECNDEKGMD